MTPQEENEFDIFFEVREYKDGSSAWNPPPQFTMKNWINSKLKKRVEKIVEIIEKEMNGCYSCCDSPCIIKMLEQIKQK